MTKKLHSKKICKGLDGLAKSFTNVGIPQVLETQLLPERKGVSAHILKAGNILLRPREHSLKIKL
jgi:hypothetical protein